MNELTLHQHNMNRETEDGIQTVIRPFTLVMVLFFWSVTGLAQGHITANPTDGDTTSADYWRAKGFNARMQGDMELSKRYYKRVLDIDPADWDANLALARIYWDDGDYDAAIRHYLPVVAYDSTNTESLWGIGRCHYRSGRFREAEKWYSKALVHLPGHTPLLEDLSYALVNSNQGQEALQVFLDMIKNDSSMANAWMGAGRVYLATGKPYTARRYLRKADQLDPNNEEIKSLIRRAEQQLALTMGLTSMYINEQEPIDMGSDTPAYNINALVHTLSLSKRVSDHLVLRFSHLIDRSHRAYFQQEDERRWYDNTTLRGTLIRGNHQLSTYLGASVNEEMLTTYGIHHAWNRRAGKFTFANHLSAGYDYYYYWNQVGHDHITNNLTIRRGKLRFDAQYRYVNVRELYLLDLDTLGRNPGQHYTVTLRYTFFSNPNITVGIYQNYRDYRYRSPRYWSPQQRTLNGALATLYWEPAEGMYATMTGNIGRDSDDIEHWEASGEMGYNRKSMSYSVGLSRFYNPWYENFIGYLSVSKRFGKE